MVAPNSPIALAKPSTMPASTPGSANGKVMVANTRQGSAPSVPAAAPDSPLQQAAVMAGAEAFTEIERFGKVKLPLLRRFAPFEKGTPPHDTLGDIFAALDFEAFQKGFAAWAARFVGVPGDVVAIDGKTARRTFKKAKGEAAIHVVTAV